MRAAGLALLGAVLTSPSLAQPAPALRLDIEGGPVSALDGPRCDDQDIPDAPARALRLADGSVQLYAADEVNRVNAGPDLRHLRHRCPPVLIGGHNDDPAAYDDRAWIASLWTADGQTIWAVVHNEFHGDARKALCPSGRYMDCWFNALTLAVSYDGGGGFQRAPGRALVAALPYRYDQVGLGHHGYFNPSNLVSLTAWQYMFAFTTRAGAQRPGNCLLRTATIARAESWQAWDGAGFAVRFADPYAGPVEPTTHVCAPVGEGALRWPVTSLVRHAPSSLFLALMQDTSAAGGVYCATSPDLLHWSAPALLFAHPGPSGWHCGGAEPIAYPSLLDPDSPDRNFETVGARALLFATRFNVANCRVSMDRVLERWEITVRQLASR